MIDFHSLEKGDRICIRGFEDMASEFGLTRDGFIRPGGGLPSCFNPNMKGWCGGIGTIQNVGRRGLLDIEFDAESLNKSLWGFWDWMVEPIDSGESYADLPDVTQLYSV